MDHYRIALENLRARLHEPIGLDDVEKVSARNLFSADEEAAAGQRMKQLDQELLSKLTNDELNLIDQNEVLEKFQKAVAANFEQYDHRIRMAVALEAKAHTHRHYADGFLRSVEAMYDNLPLAACRQVGFVKRPIESSEDWPRRRGHWSYSVRPYDLDPRRVALIELIDRKLDELTKP